MTADDTLKNIPDRIEPYIIQKELNEPVPIAEGPFRLVSDGTDGQVHGTLTFRWVPSPGVEFEGTYEHPHALWAKSKWTLTQRITTFTTAPAALPIFPLTNRTR